MPELHDIVLAEPVSWAPQTMGWWILFALVLLAAVAASISAVRRHRANRYRRSALERLERIEQALATADTRAGAMTALPVLVKQTALAFRPRNEVAALNGEAWLEFLDRSCGGREFVEGPGRLLTTLAYATPATTAALPQKDVQSLVNLVRRWIRRHRVRV